MRSILILVTVCLLGSSAYSQCNFSIPSTDGYTVHVELGELSVNAPEDCPFGYNYSLSMNYNVYFTGTNIPENLWLLNGNIDCDNPNIFYPLPNGGGTGISTTANAYRSEQDCGIASPASLSCAVLDLHIHGPGIDNQWISCALSVVPIELSDFLVRLKNREVEITWETASELNNDFFTVEKSTNTFHWEELASISSDGNHLDANNYKITDEDPFPGKSYYRLKQTDLDGQSSYSTIRTIVNDTQQDPELKIYPNPVNSILYIHSINTQGIDIFDAIGNKINLESCINESGAKKSIDLTALKSGIYFIKSGNQKAKFYKL